MNTQQPPFSYSRNGNQLCQPSAADPWGTESEGPQGGNPYFFLGPFWVLRKIPCWAHRGSNFKNNKKEISSLTGNKGGWYSYSTGWTEGYHYYHRKERPEYNHVTRLGSYRSTTYVWLVRLRRQVSRPIVASHTLWTGLHPAQRN